MARIGDFTLAHLWLVLGLCCCIVFLIKYIISRNALKQKTAKSKGIIVSCQKEESSVNGQRIPQCRPTVSFTTASGKNIKFVSSYALGTLLFYEGKEVAVSYNPDNPQDALITSIEFWIDPLLFCISGLIFFVADIWTDVAKYAIWAVMAIVIGFLVFGFFHGRKRKSE